MTAHQADQAGPCGAYVAAAATGATFAEVAAFCGHDGSRANFRLPELAQFLASRGYVLVTAALFPAPEFSAADDAAPLTVAPDQVRRLRLLADKNGATPADLLHNMVEKFLSESGSPYDTAERPAAGRNGSEVARRGRLTGFRPRIPLTGQPALVSVAVTGSRDLHWLYWTGDTLLDPSRPPGQQVTCWGRHQVAAFLPVCKMGPATREERSHENAAPQT